MMLKEIGTVDRIPEYVQGVKDRKYRLMGFGHRVYKNYDPRATVMQKTCHEVLAEVGDVDDPLLKVAMELEKIALNDPYFVERKLYPNVDFYSGITLKAMGFPDDHVHRALRPRAHGWLDQPVEGDVRGSAAQDRPPPPALHRPAEARLHPGRKPRLSLGDQADHRVAPPLRRDRRCRRA